MMLAWRLHIGLLQSDPKVIRLKQWQIVLELNGASFGHFLLVKCPHVKITEKSYLRRTVCTYFCQWHDCYVNFVLKMKIGKNF